MRGCAHETVLTIPRLELLACVLSTRLAVIVRRELPWSASEFFWTDSQVVLVYIKNTSARFKVFVAKRVQMIHDRSRVDSWHYVSSKKIPTDDGSRGKQSLRWLNGPDFLLDYGFQASEEECGSVMVNTEEVVSHCIDSNEIAGNMELGSEVCLASKEGIDLPFRSFRNWFSTVKVWSWVRRFITNCRTQSCNSVGSLSLSLSLFE